MVSSERAINNYSASASNDNACVYVDDLITFSSGKGIGLSLLEKAADLAITQKNKYRNATQKVKLGAIAGASSVYQSYGFDEKNHSSNKRFVTRTDRLSTDISSGGTIDMSADAMVLKQKANEKLLNQSQPVSNNQNSFWHGAAAAASTLHDELVVGVTPTTSLTNNL